MDEAVKDLAYYQDHHDEIGNLSDAELDALAQGDTATAEIDEAPAIEAEEPEVVDTTEQVEAVTEDAKPEGIATRDGKHVIPFEVLEKERSRAADLERIAAEQAAQIEAYNTQASISQTKAEQDDGNAATLLTEEQLVELEADLPSIAAIFRAQQNQLKSFGNVVEQLNAERKSREEERAREVNNAVQKAIDANPKLIYLQSMKDVAWDRAASFDAVLRADPEWAGKTFDERFAKVVDLYEATYGEVKLPGQTPREPSQDELTKQAEAKLKAAKVMTPKSISDIPGGTIPAVDEVVAAMNSKSGAELTADFMRMTPAQIDAALARL